MAFPKLRLSLFLLVLHGMLFLSHSMHCNEDEEKLLQGINEYRKTLNLPIFAKNSKAACLANKIADDLGNKSCEKNEGHDYSSFPGTKPKFADFQKLLNECDINVNNTAGGAILPACVPKLDQTQTLSSYTKSAYAKYLNDSNYTRASVGSKDDWMVVVLSANSSAANFSSGALSLVPNISMANCTVAFLFGLLLVSLS